MKFLLCFLYFKEDCMEDYIIAGELLKFTEKLVDLVNE